MESDSRFIFVSCASTGVGSFTGGFDDVVPLANGLSERLFSVTFGIFGILGRPDVSGCSFLAKQFGTFDPNNE